jgi:hypothetical protein
MQNIIITRYPDPKATGWAGYLEPADKSWIAFVALDGKPFFWLHRDPVTGACLSADPEEREAELAALRERDGTSFHTGEKVP